MLKVIREDPRFPDAANNPRSIQALKDGHESEILDFLSVRPLHTFVMTGWIRDNGVANPLNRGTFYGYRDQEGRLEGVALIGHVTLFETNSDSALAAFAWLTQNCPSASAVMGEAGKVSRFLSYYMDGRSRPRLICRESLFEQRSAEESDEEIPSLCLATPNEMELVVRVHAQMALEETVVNPLEVDPTGFRQRCARRIRQQRVWVCVEDGRLTFKADVITNLREITYLEGVYVSPEKRGNCFGTRCVRQLTNTLLKRTNSVCLLVKESNSAAQACYRKAGFAVRDYYETLFLQTK